MKSKALIIATFLILLSGCVSKQPNKEIVYEYIQIQNEIVLFNKQRLEELEQIYFEYKDGKVNLNDEEFKKLKLNIIKLKNYIERLEIVINYYEEQISIGNIKK